MIAPKDLSLSNNFVRNLRKVTDYLWKQEKIEGFYKGLVPNILKTGFSSASYFYTLRSMEEIIGEQNFITSFLVSCFSRILSTFVANPFGVVETRYEMAG